MSRPSYPLAHLHVDHYFQQQSHWNLRESLINTRFCKLMNYREKQPHHPLPTISQPPWQGALLCGFHPFHFFPPWPVPDDSGRHNEWLRSQTLTSQVPTRTSDQLCWLGDNILKWNSSAGSALIEDSSFKPVTGQTNPHVLRAERKFLLHSFSFAAFMAGQINTHKQLHEDEITPCHTSPS